MSAEWDDLARLAEAATPGPWEVDDDDCGLASPDAPMVATPWVAGRRTHIVGSPARPHGKPLPENAEFIAAANPATILRLIKQAQNYNAEADRHASRVVAMEAENEDLTAERDALAARLAAVEAAFENLPIFLSAIESDLRRTPEGRGGEVHFIPATPGHGKSGCPGDNITCWLDEVRAALSAAPTDTTKETDR